MCSNLGVIPRTMSMRDDKNSVDGQLRQLVLHECIVFSAAFTSRSHKWTLLYYFRATGLGHYFQVPLPAGVPVVGNFLLQVLLKATALFAAPEPQHWYKCTF